MGSGLLQRRIHQTLPDAATLPARRNEQHRHMAPFLELNQPRQGSVCDTHQHQVVTHHSLGKRLLCGHLGESLHALRRQRRRNR
ncbi:hypothetical protein D9M71_826020 [compost metagenome]